MIKRKKLKLQVHRKYNQHIRNLLRFVKGFSLVELLVVLALISVLASLIIPRVQSARSKTYYTRAKAEFKTMNTATTQYLLDNNNYPPDANRNIPPGIGQYLGGYQSTTWPQAPWPGSVYDWENWTDVDGSKIYQISIRFCPASATTIASCKFPNEPWAANFGINSSVYYCISGACRAHINEAANYPGYCVNCSL